MEVANPSTFWLETCNGVLGFPNLLLPSGPLKPIFELASSRYRDQTLSQTKASINIWLVSLAPQFSPPPAFSTAECPEWAITYRTQNPGHIAELGVCVEYIDGLRHPLLSRERHVYAKVFHGELSKQFGATWRMRYVLYIVFMPTSQACAMLIMAYWRIRGATKGTGRCESVYPTKLYLGYKYNTTLWLSA